ncbi:MAG: hypothetical protein JSR82_24655 [Verrucomicrobia bacterium]|nr:hypothetical protein [Verrucomicrobiota bacterium]
MPSEPFLRECRLMLEELASNFFRQQLAQRTQLDPRSIRVRQEVRLAHETFADLRLDAPGEPPLFVEVKYGYPRERIAHHLSRKYSTPVAPRSRLIVIGAEGDVPGLAIDPSFEIEHWSLAHFLRQAEEAYGVTLHEPAPETMHEFRSMLDRAKGRQAFGDGWVGSDFQSMLVWQFGHHQLRQLLQAGAGEEEVLAPGLYRNVVAMLVDLCSFSAYVRDTRDDEVIRHCLSAFYAKSRYAILNAGGMLLQFVGDEVIGLFGLRGRDERTCDAALECAIDLLDLGDSISNEWQRNIDRVQAAHGVHVGIATGDLQILALQPFSRARLGAVSEAINLGSRLLSAAGPSEIVVSNSFFKGLSVESQRAFGPTEPIEAKNLGRINAWRRPAGAPAAS